MGESTYKLIVETMEFDKWVELMNKSDVDYAISQFDFNYNVTIFKRNYESSKIVELNDSCFPEALKRSAKKLKEYLSKNKY